MQLLDFSFEKRIMEKFQKNIDEQGTPNSCVTIHITPPK